MQYRRFGRTEIQISAVSLGGAYLMGDGSIDPVENAGEILESAQALGVNYIDTAPLYGDSEVVLGEALKSIRSDMMISTKVGFDPQDFDYRSQSVLASLERSLKRMGVDKLIVAQIHEVNLAGWKRIMEPGGTLEGLRLAQKRGLCSFIGITGRAIPLLTRLASTGEFDTVLVYHDYHPCRRLAGKSMLPAAMENDMGVVIATILAGGLYVPGICNKSALNFLSQTECKNAEKILKRLELEDSSLPQSAFQYVLADGRVTTASSGAANVEQLREVASVTEIGPLSEDCMKFINKAWQI